MKKQLLIVILISALFSALAAGAVIYVPDHYPTIQAAINASSKGDGVIVRPGVYFENINFMGKEVVVISEQGPSVTLIDGSQAGSVVVFDTNEKETSVLEGFTITNGVGSSYPGAPGTYGGGIYCYMAKPMISYNIIRDNEAQGNGGGVFLSWEEPTLSYNEIYDNWSLKNGGGVHCFYSDALILSNLIHDNTAEEYSGGGIAIDCCSPDVKNNMIYKNQVVGGAKTYGGGGLFGSRASPHLINNTFYDNTAPDGGGVRFQNNSYPVVNNSIFWSNNAPTGKEITLAYDSFGPTSVMSIDYSDVEGGLGSVRVDSSCNLIWGLNMINSPPQFVDALNNDFHLTSASPCVNSGNNYALNLPKKDFERDPRIINGTVDMGGDEFTPYPRLYIKPDEVHAETGGMVQYILEGGPGTENCNYGLLCSLTGHSPGLPLPGGEVLPVNFDIFTTIMLGANLPFRNLWFLDPQGNQTAILLVPPHDMMNHIVITSAYAVEVGTKMKASNYVELTLLAVKP